MSTKKSAINCLTKFVRRFIREFDEIIGSEIDPIKLTRKQKLWLEENYHFHDMLCKFYASQLNIGDKLYSTRQARMCAGLFLEKFSE